MILCLDLFQARFSIEDRHALLHPLRAFGRGLRRYLRPHPTRLHLTQGHCKSFLIVSFLTFLEND
jgi:hypothetical protein